MQARSFESLRRLLTAAAATASSGSNVTFLPKCPTWAGAAALETSIFASLSRLSQFSTSNSLPKEERKKIAVGVSGGVDSAVAALLLKQAGHDVIGIFMRNWDEAEEKDNRNCSVERDLKDAAAVCRQLDIPLHEADFVSQYWNEVFTEFVAECARGLTPNPDLACNRHIKFGALLKFAASLGADTIATGHYARLRKNPDSTVVQLLKGVDEKKDQSYFLASVHAESLENVIFPLGEYRKQSVRQMAAEAGLAPAEKRSSAGICFIGRRNFSEFLSEYVPVIPGRFLDVETGKDLGSCPNVTPVTYGQRPGIGGASDRTYVAGKDVNMNVVYIATGRNHPALVTHSACLRQPHLLSAKHEEILQRTGQLECDYKARYGQNTAKCRLKVVKSAEEVLESGFKPSKFCGLRSEDAKILPGYLIVEFPEPAGSITPQQMFVMYDGEVCIGSAAIAMPGQTVFEERRESSSELRQAVGST